MRQETDRLREPAAWALVGFLALQLVVDAMRVLLGVGSGVDGFSARAYGGQSALLDVLTPALLAVAVVLVTHAGRPTPRARVVTRSALGVLGAQGIAGLTVALGALAYDGGGFADIPAAARVEQTAVNAGVLVLFALCAYFLIVVLGAPSPPTVTRGKSLPHQEWPSYARDGGSGGTGGHQAVPARSAPSGQYPATGQQPVAEHSVSAERTSAGMPAGTGYVSAEQPYPAATGPRPSETPPRPVPTGPSPAAGAPGTAADQTAVPPRPATPPPPQTPGRTRP
ncbi:hypothetical protein [Embleya sp. NBC_00896]|uniref:hypothetical protein n=1 Tax=Embleya sp. NBC_00896 TaxID=2975961 RepID=UPI00386EC941|nr:hypothetical protein OG928_12800 [Embleya sp. NBC_00896]